LRSLAADILTVTNDTNMCLCYCCALVPRLQSVTASLVRTQATSFRFYVGFGLMFFSLIFVYLSCFFAPYLFTFSCRAGKPTQKCENCVVSDVHLKLNYYCIVWNCWIQIYVMLKVI